MSSEASEDQQTQPNGTNADPAAGRHQTSAEENYKLTKRKVFNDPIHGHIELHPVCVRIIDTAQFQRLRHIKQLDACYLVYPGASHNRFEHSLGTCYLAGKLMRKLKKRQSKEEITEQDILCVEIAGLCHDLGQGPFSHVFEKKFMPKMKRTTDPEFTHEETAKKMFEYMLEDNNGKLKDDIQKIIKDCEEPGFEKFDEKDFLFIKEMIDKPKYIEGDEWPYDGRDESKSFMYEIVANKRNGIDVDKWDYLARDSYMLGMKVNFDHRRCFMSARVIRANGFYETNELNQRTVSSEDNGNNGTTGSNGTNGNNGTTGTYGTNGNNGTTGSNGTNGNNGTTGSNGTNGNNGTTGTNGTNGNNGESASRNVTVARKQICYREKDAQDFYDMFYTRLTLHRRAYQHKTHKIIGMMICDALIAANDTVKFIGKNGKKYRISDTVNDMKAYTQLTDDVFQLILYSHASAEILQSSDMESSLASNKEPSQISYEGNSDPNDVKKNERLLKAKGILNDILERNLYECITQIQVKGGSFDERTFKEKIIKPINPVPENVFDSFDFDVVRLDYGMKDKDPMAKVGFYKKDKCDTPIKLKRNQVSYVLPDTFAEHIVRIYCKVKGRDEEIKRTISKVKDEVDKWCVEENNPLPKGSNHKSQHATEPKRFADTVPDSQQSSTLSESDTDQRPEQGPLKPLPEPTVEEAVEHTEQESLPSVVVSAVDMRPVTQSDED